MNPSSFSAHLPGLLEDARLRLRIYVQDIDVWEGIASKHDRSPTTNFETERDTLIRLNEFLGRRLENARSFANFLFEYGDGRPEDKRLDIETMGRLEALSLWLNDRTAKCGR